MRSSYKNKRIHICCYAKLYFISRQHDCLLFAGTHGNAIMRLLTVIKATRTVNRDAGEAVSSLNNNNNRLESKGKEQAHCYTYILL